MTPHPEVTGCYILRRKNKAFSLAEPLGANPKDHKRGELFATYSTQTGKMERKRAEKGREKKVLFCFKWKLMSSFERKNPPRHFQKGRGTCADRPVSLGVPAPCSVSRGQQVATPRGPQAQRRAPSRRRREARARDPRTPGSLGSRASARRCSQCLGRGSARTT